MQPQQSFDARTYLVGATDPNGDRVVFISSSESRAKDEAARLAETYPDVTKAWESTEASLIDQPVSDAPEPLVDFRLHGEDPEGNALLVQTQSLDRLIALYKDLKARRVAVQGNRLFEAARPLLDQMAEQQQQ